jgi:hypothetical protein
MLPRNNKLTINNGKGVEKACWKHQQPHIRICFLRAIGGTTMLRVESVGYNVKGHQEIHRGHYKLRVIGKDGGKDIGGHCKS